MAVNAYEVTLEIDGVESVVQLDDTYPAVEDWKTATHFAIMMAQHMYPEAVKIDLISVSEYEAAEFAEYGYIHPAPLEIH